MPPHAARPLAHLREDAFAVQSALCETIGQQPRNAIFQPPGFAWLLLRRHGRRPLRFLGRLLIRIDDRDLAWRAHRPLWSMIQAFERSDGGVAACVTHTQGENAAPTPLGGEWHQAWCRDDSASLVAALCQHDPGDAFPLAGADLIRERAAWAALLQAGFGAGA